MKTNEITNLKEIRPHGTKSFPCAIYQTRSVSKGIYVKHHWHDEIEILYFPKGDFRLEINMEKYNINSECLFFVNPGELHSIYTDTAGNTGQNAIVFNMNILSFNNYDTAQIELIQSIINGKLSFPRFILPDNPAFEPILKEYNEVMNSFGKRISEVAPLKDGAITDDLINQLYIKSYLLKILALLSEYNLYTSLKNSNDKRVEAIKTVLLYIKENYTEKIYIGDLAQLIGMNEQYFSRFFKKNLGKTPMEYINEYRIRQASKRLEETQESITDICLDCGFNNMGNFLREFKKYKHTTPLNYRNRINK